MTLLREVQDAAMSGDVPLAVLLRKAQVLSVRLGHQPLRDWTRLELDGYTRADDLPDYRRLGRVEVLGHFAGAFGAAMHNAPIPRTNVPDNAIDLLFAHNVFESVGELEEIVRRDSGGEGIRYAWPSEFTALLGPRIYEGYTCMQAFKVLSTTVFVGVLETVRNRLLDFALSIEEVDPHAGETSPGEQTTVAPATVTQIFNNTITGGQVAFATSGHGKAKQDVVQQTDNAAGWPDVEARLREWGLSAGAIEELRVALDRDASGQTDGALVVGEHTQGWLGRVATQVGLGTVRLAEGVSVEVIGALLAKTAGA